MAPPSDQDQYSDSRSLRSIVRHSPKFSPDGSVYYRYMNTHLEEAVQKIRRLPEDAQIRIADALIEFASRNFMPTIQLSETCARKYR